MLPLGRKTRCLIRNIDKIMKKILLAIAVATLSISSAMAGDGLLGFLNVGGRLGIISSSQQLPTTTDGIKDIISAEGTGWTGNVFARINLPKLPLYIQPELQYTNSKIPSIKDVIDKPVTHRYIDLPVLVGAEFGLGDLVSVRVNAGPVFPVAEEKGFKDLTKEDFVNAWESFKADKQMTWTAGLGLKVLGIIAEVRYNGNFGGDTKIIDGVSINSQPTSWNMSVGVMF